MKWPHVVFALGLGSCVGLAGAIAAHVMMPESPVVRGLSIGGERLPARVSPVTWLVERDAEVRARKVSFRVAGQTFTSTLGEAGVSLDVEATLNGAAEIAHTGTFRERMRAADVARRGAVDVPFVYRFDSGKAEALFTTFAPAVLREPVDAHIDLDQHEKTPDLPGQALDVAASVRIFGLARHEPDETIQLLVRETRARVTSDDLGKVDVTRVVSSFETSFSLFGTGAGRAVNIRKAAGLIDGVVLTQGQMLSFNDRVGPRTQERGFALAPEIQGDEMQLGFGGGTCQVSSTLHVAALYGAMTILERQAHSRPSAYTMLGLDATVSYPLADLKIRNDLPYPILIHAFLPKPTALRVEILGGDPIAEVKYAFAVDNTDDFMRRIEFKSYLQPGKTVRHQKGSRGYDVTSVVHTRYHDGHVDERHYFSGYRPAPEILYVAPGTAESELPPLPEHAKGVERKGLSSREGSNPDYAL